jgi:hypothetical protein
MLRICSQNVKTGSIPVSMTTANTCPRSCPWWGAGCYSENTYVASWWGRLHARMGVNWTAFCWQVADLPAGQLWRHNEAGDLPGDGEELDIDALDQLVKSNRGKRGYTYTHKLLAEKGEAEAVLRANKKGFRINLSADSLAMADCLLGLKIGPVVVVLPTSTKTLVTPKGRKVVLCPAQTRGTTCEACGMCALDRDTVVGFQVHGLRPRQARIFADRMGVKMPDVRVKDQRLQRWEL